MELLIPGEDEEETERFRTRYLESFSSQAFGGNAAGYRERVTALPGVGAVRVQRAWNEMCIRDRLYMTVTVAGAA